MWKIWFLTKCFLQNQFLTNFEEVIAKNRFSSFSTFWNFCPYIYNISVLRKTHSMLSLSPLLFFNEQKTSSRYQRWKNCPIFKNSLIWKLTLTIWRKITCRVFLRCDFFGPAALNDNTLPPKLSITIITEDLRKFFDQTYKKRTY